MSELVSILVPAYNAERWLTATLNSALAQTWQRVEVIVVDDGSRDGTLAVARSFESRSVKVATQPNMGAPAARNKALELAQGTYIQWLDADDLLAPTKISAQMRVAEERGDRLLLLSGAFGTFYYRPEKAVFSPTSLWRDLTPVEYFVTRFTDNVYFQTDAWLVSRELSDAAGLWTDFDSPDDDGEYFCRVAARSTGVKFVTDARTSLPSRQLRQCRQGPVAAYTNGLARFQDEMYSISPLVGGQPANPCGMCSPASGLVARAPAGSRRSRRRSEATSA